MKINWEDYFDHIYCIHYLKQERKYERLKDELARVGLLESNAFTMRATDDNPYNDVVLDYFKDARIPKNIGYISLGLEVLSIMNEAIANRYSRILLLENDVAFLKDLDTIKSLLDNIPPHADIVQFDKFIVPNGSDYYRMCTQRRALNAMYFDPRNDIYYSGACVALSARAIEYEKSVLSDVLIPPDSTFSHSGLERAIAITNMAIQVVYRDALTTNLQGINSHHDGYKRGCVDYALYNVPDGYDYGSAV